MADSFAPRQLVLALDHAVSFAREDFLVGPSNAAALALIERWPDWPHRVMALVGPEGAGKSHLAAVWAETAGARVLSARLLGETDLPAALATGALVLEDLEPATVNEPMMFHLLNLAREEQAFLLLTTRSPLTAFSAKIRDLMSRLRSIPTIELMPPDDFLLRAVIVKLAADRQLTLDEGVVSYIVTRIERSFAAAQSAIARLDEEAMRRQRPVTRALAAELFR
jgi:chromosomal replication initiation ATPase DnaA